MSRVDVVVPCYNYGRYLAGCVGSVLEQPGVDVRVLIIDDCSCDDSAAIGRALAQADPRVEFRRHAVNAGHIATYNEGLLDWARGDYSLLLSADDLLAPGALARAVRIMDADRRIGLVYGRCPSFSNERQLPQNLPREAGYTRWPGRQWLAGRCRAGHNVISSPEAVVRGSVQRAVGGYRPELPHAGDLEMWMRVAVRSDVAYVKGPPQAFYRVHAFGVLRARYRGKLTDLEQRKTAFDTFFRAHPDLPNAGALADLAARTLAREALWEACRAYDRNEVEQADVRGLEGFAMQTWAGATPELRALKRRRQLGAALCHRTQLFALPAALRRMQRWWGRERWKRYGV